MPLADPGSRGSPIGQGTVGWGTCGLRAIRHPQHRQLALGNGTFCSYSLLSHIQTLAELVANARRPKCQPRRFGAGTFHLSTQNAHKQ
jgi:hypothetical protein